MNSACLARRWLPVYTARNGARRKPAEEAAVSGRHHHDHTEPPSDLVLRPKAVESLLVEKGLVDPAAIDLLIDAYETKLRPRNGAPVLPRAWSYPAFNHTLPPHSPAAIPPP